MKRMLLVAGVAFGWVIAASGPSLADPPDLGGTSWTTSNDACGLDGLEFSSDGTVDVYDFAEDNDETGKWTLTGDRLSIEYDNWYGGIEGTVYEKRIEATETWRSDETNEVHHDPCIFELD